MGPRLIEVDIRLIENTRKEVRQVARKLAGLLYKKEPKKLIFKEEPNKYELAILDGNTDLERLFFTGFTTLVFLCPEPATYGEKYIVDIGGTMHNMGTYPSKGIIKIEITEETDHLEVTLLSTGEFLYIDDNFDVGDIVVIDLEKEYVTKNDYSAMPNLYLESDFFEIPVGEFEITISSGNGILEFRERWL